MKTGPLILIGFIVLVVIVALGVAAWWFTKDEEGTPGIDISGKFKGGDIGDLTITRDGKGEDE